MDTDETPPRAYHLPETTAAALDEAVAKVQADTGGRATEDEALAALVTVGAAQADAVAAELRARLAARRTKPVRITVDLTPEDYRTMRRVVGELAERADVPTLAHSVMWRELLRLADSDPEVFDAIAERIRAERD